MRHASGWSGVTAARGQPYPRMARPPPRNRPELFAFDHHVLERPASASRNERTTSAPSPTADATRFVEPHRTSPVAKTSGRVVSRSNGWPSPPSLIASSIRTSGPVTNPSSEVLRANIILLVVLLPVLDLRLLP